MSRRVIREIGKKSKLSSNAQSIYITTTAGKTGLDIYQLHKGKVVVPPTKKCKMANTDRVEKTITDLVGCVIEKQREEDK